MRTMRHSGESPWTYLLLVLILLPFLFPLAWMLLSSLKTQVQNTAYPPVWVFTPTLNNYREVFLKNPFFTFTLNSLIVAAGSTGLALVLGLAGRVRGRPIQADRDRARHPHRAHGPGDCLPDSVVHPLHQAQDDRHLLWP